MKRDPAVATDKSTGGATQPRKDQFAKTATLPEDDSRATELDEATLKSIAAGAWADKVDQYLPTLSTPQGNKLQTLTVAALGSRPRHAYFVAFYNNLIDLEQVRQVEKIVDSFDWAYEDLIQRRHQILENHRDGELVKRFLQYNNAAMLAVNVEIRAVVYQTVLTPEQRTEFQSRYVNETASATPSQDAGERPADQSDSPMP